MDITKQYPKLSLDYENAAVFDIEGLLSTLGLSSVDLIHLSRTLDRNIVSNLSVRSGRTSEEVIRMINTARKYFEAELKETDLSISQTHIPTNLRIIDESLLGGVPLGQITEVFGASGCGKSQFLLSLAVNALKLGGGSKNICIYISTESTLESRRLNDFSKNVPRALDRISYIYCPDLEHQDHILFTQLRVKLQKEISEGNQPRMVVIDSVGHHLRAENTFLNSLQFFRSHLAWQEEQLGDLPMYQQEKVQFDSITNKYSKGDAKFRNRTSKQYYLFSLYAHLSELAHTYNVAVVLANQVSDVMDRKYDNSFGEWTLGPEDEDPLAFNFQVGTFLGWDAGSYMILDSFDQPDPKLVGQGAEQFKRDGENRKRKYSNDRSTEKNIQKNDVCSEERQLYRGPKKKVPAMGYTWSKLITHRILLWKTYQPIIEHAKEEVNYDSRAGNKNVDGENSTFQQETPNSDQKSQISPSQPVMTGFKIQRFARVVLSHALIGAATAEFEISQKGVCGVHADANTGHNT